MSMKIVLDLQGAQSKSRDRGIGRYTISMARAFVEQAVAHDVWLVLNGRYPESAADLMHQFADTVPRERMLMEQIPVDVAGCIAEHAPRARRAEAERAERWSRMNADCVWHSSLFEGWLDDSVAALGTGGDDKRHAATLYDFIPLLHPERHLRNRAYRRWYYHRLALVKRCGLLFALSESTRRDAVEHLQLLEENIAVVHGGVDAGFRPTPSSAIQRARWRNDWGLGDEFILYVGGYDAHKNVDTLVEAYATLAPELRERYPLVLAGQCNSPAQERLVRLARRCGVASRNLMFTGRVEDDDLVGLYSTCTLFVAPSLYEGLGLPPLEAMACGAAVIGSNRSSLPEVIGAPEALFDPRSRSDIAQRMHAALADPGYLQWLSGRAIAQSSRFTWRHSAQRALDAMERNMTSPGGMGSKARPRSRPRLAYVSPLPPAHSGIADYSARMLPELATQYDIDVVVDQPRVSDTWIQANFPLRDADWLLHEAGPDTRLLYHFGNSPFHEYMFELLRQRPGTVMLHDVWLSAVRNWMSNESGDPESFLRLLYRDHGYPALVHDSTHGREKTLDVFPVSRDVIESADGLIVHSRHALDLLSEHYGSGVANRFDVVPFPRQSKRGDRRASRRLLGLNESDFMVCSFGMLAPTKLNRELIKVWLESSLAQDASSHLVFVGENHGGAYGEELCALIGEHAGNARIHITGHVDAATYEDYLVAADAAVQLRRSSRGETSAAVFDVLAHGLPLLINAHGSAMELPDGVCMRLPDRFTTGELAKSLQALRSNTGQRKALTTSASEMVMQRHRPADVARAYREVIERNHLKAHASRLAKLTQSTGVQDAVDDLPRLYVDVTAVSESGRHTGIERVVRGVLLELLGQDRSGFRLEPVRMRDGAYETAPDYALRLLDIEMDALTPEVVEPVYGDVFLGLDWVADRVPGHQEKFTAWRDRGVRMLFVIYDLLPVQRPDWFPPGMDAMHAEWLQCIGTISDALLCISHSVAEDAQYWFRQHPLVREQELSVGYFYPGNDPVSTRPTLGLPEDAEKVLAELAVCPMYLMVGTIEPRKGHAFVLDAFERAWGMGADINLVIVGRPGWMSEDLIERMRNHEQLERRLWWMEQASDEYMGRIMDTATALIAASEGEGFGLPLVEAAREGLPVLARDIPVFREVGDGFADYFDGLSPEHLTSLLMQGVKPETACECAFPAAVSWKETTAVILEMLRDPDHGRWLPSLEEAREPMAKSLQCL